MYVKYKNSEIFEMKSRDVRITNKNLYPKEIDI